MKYGIINVVIRSLQNANFGIQFCFSFHFSYRLRQKSWSPGSVSCVAARKIVLGPVRDITAISNQPNKLTNHFSCTEGRGRKLVGLLS